MTRFQRFFKMFKFNLLANGDMKTFLRNVLDIKGKEEKRKKKIYMGGFSFSISWHIAKK